VAPPALRALLPNLAHPNVTSHDGAAGLAFAVRTLHVVASAEY